MSVLKLICKEIIHRKFNFLLALLAMVIAVAFFVSSVTIGTASHRETVRNMRGTGLNLRIINQKTDMNKFWRNRCSEYEMPLDYVYKLSQQKTFTANHLIGFLTKPIKIRGREALLTGIAPEEIIPRGGKKSRMISLIAKGTVDVGYQIARDLNLRRNDTIEIMGKKFIVDRCAPESGNPEGDDIRIQCHLDDAQEILNLPGKINEIKALDCMCLAARNETPDQTLHRLRNAIVSVLPDTQVFQWKNISEIRHDQRNTSRRFIYQIVIPSVVVVCMAWVGLLTLVNVRDRRGEIGILRALGYGSAEVALLFLGKAAIVGLIGAAIGFLLGSQLALTFGPNFFTKTALAIKPIYNLLTWSLIGAPIVAALGGLIPSMIAVIQDPAVTLREE